MSITSKLHRFLLPGLLLAASATLLHAQETVVQIPVESVLNGRCVTTLTDGKLVPYNVGVDGGGKGSGYFTMAASLFVGDKEPKALPDVATFAANDRHPEIKLHYSNTDGTSNQVRPIKGLEDFTLPVPPADYARLILCFTSSEGSSNLTIVLNYADGTSDTVETKCPDYFVNLSGKEPNVFYVINDLAKWSKDGKMREKDHHHIFGLDLRSAAGKSLVSVKVTKTTEKSYLVFWGATGVVRAK